MIPKIIKEKDIIWQDNQTKEVYEHFNADNISLALTGTDLTWIQENKPEILDYVLVKGKVERVFLMVVVSMLPQAEMGRNYDRDNASHFIYAWITDHDEKTILSLKNLQNIVQQQLLVEWNRMIKFQLWITTNQSIT